MYPHAEKQYWLKMFFNFNDKLIESEDNKSDISMNLFNYRSGEDFILIIDQGTTTSAKLAAAMGISNQCNWNY